MCLFDKDVPVYGESNSLIFSEAQRMGERVTEQRAGQTGSRTGARGGLTSARGETERQTDVS